MSIINSVQLLAWCFLWLLAKAAEVNITSSSSNNNNNNTSDDDNNNNNNNIDDGDQLTGLTFEKCLESALVSTEFFCLPHDYRKDVPPPMTAPIQVYINLPLSEISAIDDQHSQISIRLYYKLLWPEPRMVLNSSSDWSSGRKSLGARLIHFFWTPDLIIHDLVKFYKPEMVKEVAALKIWEEKSVYYKLRADLTVVCKGMEFGMYPFDKHVCYLKLTSFGHKMDALLLSGGFTYEDENQRELNFNVEVAEVHGSTDVFVGQNDNYSMYSLEIRLTRFMTPYLLKVYLPTGIFVIMSWVSFIIPVDIIAARITLLVTLCLVLINSFNNATEKIPVARQETALEVWISGCVSLVFAALAEYAFILFKMTRLRRQLRLERENMVGENTGNGGNNIEDQWDRSQLDGGCNRRTNRRSPDRPRWRDTLHVNYQSDGGDGQQNEQFKRRIAQFQLEYDEKAWRIYPGLFALFNLIYWAYYYSMRP